MESELEDLGAVPQETQGRKGPEYLLLEPSTKATYYTLSDA